MPQILPHLDFFDFETGLSSEQKMISLTLGSLRSNCHQVRKHHSNDAKLRVEIPWFQDDSISSAFERSYSSPRNRKCRLGNHTFSTESHCQRTQISKPNQQHYRT